MVKLKIIKNRRGWVKIVEVFVAILLLTGILLIVANKSNSAYEESLYTEVSQTELSILRDIELNETLREGILSTTLPVEWDNFGAAGIENVKNRIIFLSPSNLECKAKVCSMSGVCIIDGLSGKNVYAQSVIIAANSNIYAPRQLKLFCMEK